MASNYAARAATSPELVKFRAQDGSKLHLAFLHPEIVYTAQIDQDLTGLTSVTELAYDGGSGTLANVLMGMTIAIGTTAGARDVGLFRVRRLPTETVLYINQSPVKRLAEDQYITIYDDFRPWHKEIRAVGTDTIRMDFDIELNDVNYGAALLRVAPQVAVLFRDALSGEVTFTPPSPSLSACYDGATIISYLYEFLGSASSGNLTSSTGEAFAVYDTAGEYRWSVTAIDSIGRRTTTYRRVLVDPPEVPFELDDCEGVKDDGWSFTIVCHDDVTKAEVIEGALCVLYSEDWYGGTKGSIGKIAGYENIIAVGWIDGENIDFDSEDGSVVFSAYSVNNFLAKLLGSPIELTNTISAPTSWKQIEGMTADMALAHVLNWTTTLPLIMDCFLTGSTIEQNIFTQPDGSPLDQLTYIADKIFAGVQNNNLGQLYVQIDPQLMSDFHRAALPVVMDIKDMDSEDERNVERKPINATARVEMSAMISYNGATPQTVYSRAISGDFGDVSSYDDFSVDDQVESNYIAGRLLAMLNNEFENVEISMPSNNRLFDVCPPMLATLSFTETKRGVIFEEQPAIPHRVRLNYDAKNETISIELDFELVVESVDGDTYYPPPVSDTENDNFQSGLDFGGIDFPSNDLGSWFPSTNPPGIPLAPCLGEANSFRATWDPNVLRGDDPEPIISRCYFPCRVRPKSYNVAQPSTVSITGRAFGDAASKFALYGVLGGVRVVTADSLGQFDVIMPQAVDGFEVELEAGLGTVVRYIPTDIVTSGTADATDPVGTAVALEVGEYYSIEGTGGVWHASPGGANQYGSLGLSGLSVVHTEPGNPPYTRAYYKATSASANAFIADSQYDDNDGSLSWVVRLAIADGRRLEMGTAIIRNVCALDEP